jgi:hypothetical protein
MAKVYITDSTVSLNVQRHPGVYDEISQLRRKRDSDAAGLF